MKTTIALLASAATFAFAASASAKAQSSDSSTAISESGLGDIVVTARRRAESLQSVPVAVTAIMPEALRSKTISTPYDLLSTTPGLQVQAGSNSRNDPIYFIRGQGQTPQAEVSVVQYFAEVPQPVFGESIGSNIQFYDLENIQVLKGPQGTLFGRSSTGGAVLFTPKKPGQDFDGFADHRRQLRPQGTDRGGQHPPDPRRPRRSHCRQHGQPQRLCEEPQHRPGSR